MTSRTATLRFVLPSAVSSLILLSLCGFMAVYLYRLQTTIAEELGENIFSRQAAFQLEEALEKLLQAHLRSPEKVPAAQEPIPALIEQAVYYANKPEEQRLTARLQEGYSDYQHALANLPIDGPEREPAYRAAVGRLEADVLRVCLDLRTFNSVQIELSEEQNRKTLRMLAWGLAGIGVIGSIGGLLMGIGLARWLQQSIHRLQVRVQDAAGKLGQELPAVVITGHGLEQLDKQVRDIVGQIENVVQQLQQREREVLRAEQLAAVGHLAAGVAHELRNPLTSIKLLVETIAEDAAARGTKLDDFQVIVNEIRRMERSLNQFLEFARPPKPEKSPHDLGKLIEQTLVLVQGRAAKQRVDIEYHRPERAVIVEADGGLLQQVCINLALNALDAMPQGGRLIVGMNADSNGNVELTVRDTGPGVAPDMIPRLFEPFASNKETGLGLGLVTSRRIVEDHGGTLRMMPQTAGAGFCVRLPTQTSKV